MSGLADILKQVIQEKRLKQTEVAVGANIDRTTLSKVINGRRAITRDQLENVCSYLGLPMERREELRAMLEEETLGQGTYSRNETVRNLLNHLYHLDEIDRNMITMPGADVALDESRIQVVNGVLNVSTFIQQFVLNELNKNERVLLKTNCQMKYNKYVDLWYSIYCAKKGAVEVDHIICVESGNNMITGQGLSSISDVIAVSLATGVGYRAYYYYVESIENESRTLPYIYYIVVNDKVLLLSEQIDSAMLIVDAAVAQSYSTAFDKVRAMAEPVVVTYNGPAEALVEDFAYDENYEDSCVIQYEPTVCLTWSAETLVSHARIEVPGVRELAELSYNRYKRMQSHDCAKTKVVFSRIGLDSLMETGYSIDYPRGFMTPFTYEERLEFAERNIERIKHGSFIRIANEAQLQISQNCATRVDMKGVVQLIVIKDNLETVKSLILRRPAEVAPFIDFVNSLPLSRMVLSKEETLRAFEDHAKRLRAKIAAGEKV